MNDVDSVPRGGAFKVLIPLRNKVVEVTVGGIGEKCLRLNFGIDRLCKHFIKG